MKRIAKTIVVAAALALIYTGLSSTPWISLAQATEISGHVLHAYSHDTSSSYTEIHVVNSRLKKNDNYTIEQTVLAANYSGSAGVVLLELQVTENGNTEYYSIYWYGGNTVYIYTPHGSTNMSLDMSQPHTYKIEATKNQVKFYIDDAQVYSTSANIKKIQQVNTGRWDENSTYDLYIDNIKEYWNGNLNSQEDFEDGSDDFYTSDAYNGSGDSGEEIIQPIGIPEYPFLEPILEALARHGK